MKFTTNENLLNIAFESARKHFQDLIDEHRELCRGYKIRLQLLSASDQLKTHVRESIKNEFVKGAKALTNSELDKILDNTFNHSINTALASTITDYEGRYDKLHIYEGRISIAFNKETLLADIVNNLWRFDEYLSVRLKMVARHEFGHVVQSIHNDGINNDEYLRKEMKNSAAMNEFHKWLDSSRADGSYSKKEFCKRYFQIPHEKDANNFAGYTWKDMYAWDGDKKPDDVSISISTIEKTEKDDTNERSERKQSFCRISDEESGLDIPLCI